jgi:UDP-N-acetylmuramoyl-tripeptide--D-alanyl-D-alanine ligase
MKIALAQALEAFEALDVRARGGALPATFGVSTDTRTLAPGDAFVALCGERYDGHAFLAEALAKGAAGLIVSDEARVPPNAAALVVADTTRAYLALGGVALRQSRAQVAAVTGSTGKTTTKAFLAQLLEVVAPGRVAATVANENNEIGVAKLLLSLPGNAAFAVVEFGARHYGEIEPLATAAQPHVGVLTNVGDAHLEIMGSRARLAETKWGIFATGARAVLSVADAVSRERAPGIAGPVVWAALEGEGDDVELRTNDVLVRLVERERLEIRTSDAFATFATHVAVAGDHNRRNAVAAAAAAFALCVLPADIAHGLATLALPPGRYERVKLGDFEAIYDAYNASMSGTLATLASFGREVARRRIAVLGSMAELGADAPEMHARVGRAAAESGLAALLVGGDYADDLVRGACEGGLPESAIVTFASNSGAVAWLRAHLVAGDLVLLKGSRRYRLEEILSNLQATHAG